MRIFKIIISEVLRIFGALWLLVESISFFNNDVSLKVKSLWWLFGIVGIIIIIVRLWPRKRFLFQIFERDIAIEIVIGDIFKLDGPIIIGSNTDFNVDTTVISERSIQGQFCKKYFPDTKILSSYINQRVKKFPAEFGTTIKIDGNGKTGYFCAIATLNTEGIAKSNLENVRTSLAELWNYLSNSAEKDFFNIPIIGSGFARVNVKREILAKEIIRSFIAAISQYSFCDGLRIVFHPNDIKKYNININDFIDFVKYSCRYVIEKPTNLGSGTPEG